MTMTRYVIFGVFSYGVIAPLALAQSGPGALRSVKEIATLVQDRRAAPAVEDVMNKVIAVQIQSVPLEQALEHIGARAGVHVTYSRTVIPYTRRVTVQGEKMMVGQALSRVLHGTGTHAQLSPTGQIVIVKDTDQGAAQGILSGKIIHAKTKQPVAGATILVNGTSISVSSGPDGTFRIPVAAGRHTISIRAVGFTRQIRQVDLEGDKATAIEIVLEPSASVLDEVVVTGTVVATARKEIPTPITVITAEEIQKRNITRIEQFFRGEVPGVIALERGSMMYESTLGAAQRSEVYSRGGSDLNGKPSPLKTYVDGVEIYDANYLGTLDVQSIERIEIITGPQAATIYGSGAIGGVMQIFTKRGSMTGMPEIRLTARYGMLENSLSTGRTPTHNDVINVTGGSGGAFSYSSSASYNYSGQWQPLMFNRSYGFSLGATHRAGPVTGDGSFSVNNGETGTGSSPGQNLKIDNGEISRDPFFFQLYPTTVRQQIRNKSSSQNFAFNVNHRISRLWSHSLTLGRSANAFRLVPLQPLFLTPADTAVAHERRSGSRTAWGYNLSFVPSALRFVSMTSVIGVNGTMSEGMSLSGGNATGFGGLLATSVQASIDPDIANWGGFGTWRIGLFRQLYFTLGMRLESNPAYGKNVNFDFTPTNGLAWTFEYGEMTLKLLGSYGKATRAPDATSNVDRFTSNANTFPITRQTWRANLDLTPEYETGPQGGFELFYGNLGSVSLNLYRGRVTDLIQSIPAIDSTYFYNLTNPDFPQYQPIGMYINVGTIKKHGIESSASVNLGPVAVRGTYSWNDSRIEYVHPRAQANAILNWYPGKSWKMVPTHTGALNVGYSLGKISLSANNSFIGGHGSDLQYHPWYGIKPPLRLRMYSERPRGGIGANQEYFVAGYIKTDVVVQYTATPWSTMSLNITNAGNSFGSEADRPELTPTLGRNTVFGISLRYPRNR